MTNSLLEEYPDKTYSRDVQIVRTAWTRLIVVVRKAIFNK